MVNNKGSVVMIGLWILSVLAVLAVNLGWRAQAGLKLAGNQRDKLRASLLAKAGLSKAMYLLSEDAKDALTKDYDTANACGVNLSDKKAEEIFREENPAWGGSFDIGYRGSDGELVYGMRDEESRININGATPFDKNKLIALFNLKGMEDFGDLGDYVISWISESSSIEMAKKKDFTVTEELLLAFESFYRKKELSPNDARAKAREVFSKIKDLVMVNSKTESKINLNTASADVLSVVFEAWVESKSISDTEKDALKSAASDLVNKIMEFREKKYVFDVSDKGGVVSKFTNPPSSVVISGAQEDFIGELFTNKLVDIKSDNFRVEVTGKAGKMFRKVAAIIKRTDTDPPKIISYQYD